MRLPRVNAFLRVTVEDYVANNTWVVDCPPRPSQTDAPSEKTLVTSSWNLAHLCTRSARFAEITIPRGIAGQIEIDFNYDDVYDVLNSRARSRPIPPVENKSNRL